MGPANLGVVLDSSVVIEAERQRLDVARFLKHISTQIGEREAALCSIGVAELAHGIHRADTPERRRVRRAFLDDLKAAVPVYPIPGKRRSWWERSMLNHPRKASPSLSTICSSVLAPSNVATLSPRATRATFG